MASLGLNELKQSSVPDLELHNEIYIEHEAYFFYDILSPNISASGQDNKINHCSYTHHFSQQYSFYMWIKTMSRSFQYNDPIPCAPDLIFLTLLWFLVSIAKFTWWVLKFKWTDYLLKQISKWWFQPHCRCIKTANKHVLVCWLGHWLHRGNRIKLLELGGGPICIQVHYLMMPKRAGPVWMEAGGNCKVPS